MKFAFSQLKINGFGSEQNSCARNKKKKKQNRTDEQILSITKRLSVFLL